MPLALHIEGIEPDRPIPRRFTKDGENVSPAVRWSGVPAGTAALALVLEDTSADFVHWIVYDIPPDRSDLPGDLAHRREPDVPGPVRHGRNDLGNVGYDGPAPAVGRRHHYRFRLYALDRALGADETPDRDALERALAGHVLDRAERHAVYERPRP